MPPKLAPLDEEIKLSDDEFIVSKTDPEGRLTYANRVFMEIASYSEPEILGKQHNVIRHPDMPRGVFRLLWNTIKQEKEFFGFVKNLCADGRYYWVFANVTPDYDRQGNLIGYLSVRRKPPETAIDAIIPIYTEMLKIEHNSSSKKTAPDESIAYLESKLKATHASYQDFVLSLYND